MVDLIPSATEDGGMPRSDDPPALLFFAFRRLTEEPDRVLALRGLGRVHHRILYFVARNPGIHIGGLLEILKVSKQALHRPLRQLVRRGLVGAATSPSNRRLRQLSLTREGRALEARLTGSQHRRFSRTFREVGAEMETAWREVMRRLGGP
jgi:DNA-binding MarR family transcriptional regulator